VRKHAQGGAPITFARATEKTGRSMEVQGVAHAWGKSAWWCPAL